jgi:hypothetical protein
MVHVFQETRIQAQTGHPGLGSEAAADQPQIAADAQAQAWSAPMRDQTVNRHG